MSATIRSFSSLYLATLLMVLAAGLLTTYLGLRLAAIDVSKHVRGLELDMPLIGELALFI